MPLPTCICIAGRPPFDRLGDIFCALSQIDLECVVPTLLSATIVGDQLTLVFSEEVTGHTGFSLEMNVGTVAVTYDSGEGTNTLVFTADTAAEEGEDVFLNYTPGDVASGPECPLAALNEIVTNNTGLQFVYLRPGGVDGYFRPGGVDTYIRP